MYQSSSGESKQLQLVLEFHEFYGTGMFITAFTRAHHLSLSWARSNQSMPHHTSWRSVLILSSRILLGFPTSLLSSCLPTKTLYTTLLPPICTTRPLISFFFTLSPE